MKAEIVGNTKGFKPVSIQLTFETKSELAAWLLMTNDWTVTEAKKLVEAIIPNVEEKQQ